MIHVCFDKLSGFHGAHWQIHLCNAFDALQLLEEEYPVSLLNGKQNKNKKRWKGLVCLCFSEIL